MEPKTDPDATPANPVATTGINALLNAALQWFKYGFNVIPIHPGTQTPSVDRSNWLSNLSAEAIEHHWQSHPADEVGGVLTSDMVVLATPTPAAEATFWELMRDHGGPPYLSMKKGDRHQHFFLMLDAVPASSSNVEDGIHIMGSGSIVPLAPSAGLEVSRQDVAKNVSELFDLPQTTMSRMRLHNEGVAKLSATQASHQTEQRSSVGGTDIEDPKADTATEIATTPSLVCAPAHIVSSIGCAMPKLNPLVSHSLRDRYTELEGQTAEESAVLGDIALMGQATVIYAKPNTGKTLLTLRMIMDAIEAKRIDPENVMYLNMDDHANGLLEKIQIASMWRFHILAEGHAGFEAKKFVAKMKEMIDTDTARGVILILDTLKMFVDTMHKGRTRAFTQLVRKFVLKGGTVVALSHTNKKQGADGKSIYSGTSDVVDDFDAAYFLTEVQTEDGVRTVMFENFKRRGNVAPTAAYTYSTVQSTSYSDLLVSVTPVDAAQLQPLQQAVEQRSDADIIEIIKGCIQEGMHAKMALVKESSQRGKVSMRAAQAVLEKYIGSDPGTHLWNFEVKARGEKFFTLLAPESPQASG